MVKIKEKNTDTINNVCLNSLIKIIINPTENKNMTRGIRFPESKIPKKNKDKNKPIINNFLLSSLSNKKIKQTRENRKNF